MVDSNAFRADLFYRLSVFPICLPPLRDRREDIPALVRHFIAKYSEGMNKNVEHVPSETMEAMVAFDWPGNIRQLQNFIERGVIVSQGSIFQPPLGQLRTQKDRMSASAMAYTRKTLEDATRDHVLQTLEDTKWVVGGKHGAAARLGIARTTLVSKMRRLGIEFGRDEAGNRVDRHQSFGAIA
jgi:transcriptional regulator with PAS, ATPase and Fis domain